MQISNNSSSPTAFTGPFDTWDGTNFRVTWASNNKLFGARVSSTGAVLDPGGILIPGPMSGPTTSTGNGTVQVAWSVLKNDQWDTSHREHFCSKFGEPESRHWCRRAISDTKRCSDGTNWVDGRLPERCGGEKTHHGSALGLEWKSASSGPHLGGRWSKFGWTGRSVDCLEWRVYLATWGMLMA